MLKKSIWITSVFLVMFLGLIGISLAFDGPIDQVYAQRGKPHDVCGRLLYYSDGTPQYYRNPCPAPNGVDLMAGVSPALNNRFEPAYVAYSVGGSWVEAVSMDDFDQDEKLDMALSTSSYFDPTRDQRVWVAKQNSPTNFSLTYSGTVGASDPRSLDVANMNDDSALGIVVANAGGGTSGKGDVEIFWGSGAIFTRTDHLAGDTPYAVATIPVNTKMLAVITNWNDVILSSYLGGNNFTVTRTNYVAPQAGWNQLATGDFNNDSNPDIVAMWGQTYAVPAFTEYFGNGLGGLSIGPNFAKNNQNPSAITGGDITYDGRDDVVIARGGNDAEILVYAQQPTGVLSLTATYSSYDIPESLDVADVNCDGINDLIATNAGWYAFSWWPGQPDGTLGPYQIETHSFYFSHIGPNGAEMADVNGDGLKDYVVADYNSKGILIALQRSCSMNKVYLPLIRR